MNDLPADVAEADVYDVLVDNQGTIWIRLSVNQWTYISDLNKLSWDVHQRLPQNYEPYRPLDIAARLFVMKSVQLGQLETPH